MLCFHIRFILPSFPLSISSLFFPFLFSGAILKFTFSSFSFSSFLFSFSLVPLSFFFLALSHKSLSSPTPSLSFSAFLPPLSSVFSLFFFFFFWRHFSSSVPFIFLCLLFFFPFLSFNFLRQILIHFSLCPDKSATKLSAFTSKALS